MNFFFNKLDENMCLFQSKIAVKTVEFYVYVFQCFSMFRWMGRIYGMRPMIRQWTSFVMLNLLSNLWYRVCVILPV